MCGDRRTSVAAVGDAQREEGVITRRGAEAFSLTYKATPRSPLDVPGIKTKAPTRDILDSCAASAVASDLVGLVVPCDVA